MPWLYLKLLSVLELGLESECLPRAPVGARMLFSDLGELRQHEWAELERPKRSACAGVGEWRRLDLCSGEPVPWVGFMDCRWGDLTMLSLLPLSYLKIFTSTLYLSLALNLLCRPHWPYTRRDSPASAVRVLWLKAVPPHQALYWFLLNYFQPIWCYDWW